TPRKGPPGPATVCGSMVAGAAGVKVLRCSAGCGARPPMSVASASRSWPVAGSITAARPPVVGTGCGCGAAAYSFFSTGAAAGEGGGALLGRGSVFVTGGTVCGTPGAEGFCCARCGEEL